MLPNCLICINARAVKADGGVSVAGADNFLLNFAAQ